MSAIMSGYCISQVILRRVTLPLGDDKLPSPKAAPIMYANCSDCATHIILTNYMPCTVHIVVYVFEENAFVQAHCAGGGT